MQRVISDTRLPIKIWASDLEAEAEAQVRNIANLPFIFKHVAVMPDAHAGKGSTIGTVIATNGAIIPAAVGVDIGCGMSAVRLPFKVDVLGGDEKLRALRHSIERAIPTGRHGHSNEDERRTAAFKLMAPIYIEDDSLKSRAYQQLGTLGGGNHFIEICKDKEDGAWIVLHSGSRNIGKVMAEHHINKAKDMMKQYFISLPDPDLAYLVQWSPEFKDYVRDLHWAQNYAKANRAEMMERVFEQVYRHVYGDKWDTMRFLDYPGVLAIDCHHNYTQMENHFGKNIHITRKGAVSARDGEWGIIPGSMGTRSYIVRGRGNLDSFCSCAHGAGRRMSRTQARKTFTVADLERQTQGVECPKTEAFLDEIPDSYKDIDVVMQNQADLVEVVHELKQIICVKGAT